MDCKVASRWTHEYLDGTLTTEQGRQWQQHLRHCPDCRRYLDSLEQTEGLLRAVPAAHVPESLTTASIMEKLPRPRRSAVFKQWIKRHPAASVAAVFLLVMLSSFLSLWDRETSLIVKGNDLEGVVIEGSTVIVPKDRVVSGDLTVENGRLQIEGAVDGNVIVIDGSVNMASTASIAGQVTSINQTIDYFWFRVKEFFSGFSR